jgi:pimeloyl-ACP methyl ester carboxylesterase
MLTAMRAALGDGFYMVYFQQPGVAEAGLERDVRKTMRMLLYSASGDAPRSPSAPPQPVIPPGKGFLDIMIDPEQLPAWLSEADIDVYVAEFERTGFLGGLNWYRTIDLSWELLAAWNGAPLLPPTLYVAGDRDLVVNFPGRGDLSARLRTAVPRLTRIVMLPGCGHWTQQERPDEVNAAMLEFLRGL